MCGFENGVSPVSTMYFLKIFPFSTLCSLPPNGIQSYSWFGIPEWPLWHPSVPMRAIYFSVRYFSFLLLFPNQLSVGWSSVLFWRWKKKLMKFPFRHIISSSLKQSHVTSHMSIVSSSLRYAVLIYRHNGISLNIFQNISLNLKLEEAAGVEDKKTKRNKTQYSSSLTRSSRHLAEHPSSERANKYLGNNDYTTGLLTRE